MRSLKLLIAAWLLALAPLVHAGEAAPVVPDPALEKRVTKLAEELRCLVCQNQTIADSHADLAVDLKNQIREMLKSGKSEKEVLDFMVKRYGDFVLYNPPVKSTTWVLWAGPFVLMALGVGVLFLKLRRRQQSLREISLSAADHERAQIILGETEKREGT